MPCQITFNADDLGICPGTNEGIEAAAEGGLVRSTSLCVTGDALEEGVRVAHRRRLATGLHFSLTLGSSLTGPLRGLTNSQGRFLSVSRVLMACLCGRVVREEVRGELIAQLDCAKAAGIEVEHLDGHQHVHTFPVVRDAMFDVLRERWMGHVRLPIDRTFELRRGAQRALVSTFGLRTEAESKQAGVVVRSTPFLGMAHYDAWDHARRFSKTLKALPPRDHEWMVHPRFEDSRFAELNHLPKTYITHSRLEMATLIDPGSTHLVRAAGFKIGTLRGERTANSAASFQTST